jgi:hypothetical protein
VGGVLLGNRPGALLLIFNAYNRRLASLDPTDSRPRSPVRRIETVKKVISTCAGPVGFMESTTAVRLIKGWTAAG